MGYDRGNSFSFDFEQNGIPFGSKSKGKPSPRSYHIQFERKWRSSFLSACSVNCILCELHICREIFCIAGYPNSSKLPHYHRFFDKYSRHIFWQR